MFRLSSSPLCSAFLFSVVTAWILLSCSSCCQYAFAFAAFTKIPNSLVDDRFLEKERRNPLTRLTASRSRPLGNKPDASNHIERSNSSNARSSTGLASTTTDGGSDSDDAVQKGRILLALVAMLYGTLNVSLRFVYDLPEVPPSAAALSATRGWIAFLCFLPPLLRNKLKSNSNTVVEVETVASSLPSKADAIGPLFRSGVELALWNFLAQGLLNVGLVSTGSARASFLTQTSVLFTPLISTLIGKQKVGRSVWCGCLVALVGLVVLTLGGGGSAEAAASAFSLSFSKGDLCVLGGALSWSMYVFRISFLGPKHLDLALQGVKTGLVAVLYSVWWMASAALSGGGLEALSWSSLPSWMVCSPMVWFALLFSAVGPGTIADVLQQKGQKVVTPSEANILLSAEPIFATVFAVLLLGETSSLLEIVGGGLIIAAAAIASVPSDNAAGA
ncbi:unnamed protein product [Pseudo-nitzschia multistriata]|uniref:EamA domain-containing protein n=1 Tax=Pseudo-nitzschia multistriata TaxID=183589 RepID=A0A448YWH0_9STRA|nr:unnamed protein product [Pseudo-nitzschia multistriata]